MKLKLLFLMLFVSALSFAQLSSEQTNAFTISPNPGKNNLIFYKCV